ncbi:hypothetical protein L6164_000172 [Bauhinia variegata]|uniref:Uncharacterized protein n=1 Tax=Bauhinia variegata TaxID=167791 RepID=A0ACB9Q5N3_BAUVA|nr:hypothetical protein L6164_000172 [Bauhinia variegata]
MLSGKTENPQKCTLQIQQDDKFFCRLLSKESSMAHSSFRVAAVTVPFVWESEPGTPKFTFSEQTLPPLTPPPSYFFETHIRKPEKKRSRSKLLSTLFPKLNLKKTLLSSSPSSLSTTSSTWSLSDSSNKAIPMARMERRRRFSSLDSSFDFRGYEEEEQDDNDVTSSNSTLCFGIRRRSNSDTGFRGCCKIWA